MKTFRCIIILLSFIVLAIQTPLGQANPFSDQRAASSDGWLPLSLRDEIRPLFRVEPAGGRNSNSVLVIEHDAREGLDGFWMKTFPVSGGQFYRFQAFRRTRS